MHRQGPLIRVMLRRLADAAEKLDSVMGLYQEHDQMDAILWVMFIGAMIAEGERGAWFSNRLETLVQTLGIKGPDALKAQLQGFAWDEGTCMVFCHDWWERRSRYGTVGNTQV